MLRKKSGEFINDCTMGLFIISDIICGFCCSCCWKLAKSGMPPPIPPIMEFIMLAMGLLLAADELLALPKLRKGLLFKLALGLGWLVDVVADALLVVVPEELLAPPPPPLTKYNTIPSLPAAT